MGELIFDNTSESLIMVESQSMTGRFIYLDHSCVLKGEVGAIKIKDLVRWVALARIDPYWITPFFGTSEAEIPMETQYLLWEKRDGTYGILLPAIDGDLRTTLKGNENGLCFVVNGALKGEEPEIALGGFISSGSNPYELTHNSVKSLSEKLGSFKLREDKYTPEFIDYLGWCTWDAFKHEVDEDKVIQGLESFKKGGVQPGFMILDDGGLDTEGDYLNNFAVHPVKFPGGLKKLVNRSKEEYGIKLFGLWHAFEGYWAGINPDGDLAKKYKILPTIGVIRPWEEKSENLYLIDPKEIYLFYQDFYRFIYNEGIDMLKVDGQSALEIFTEGILGRASTMRTYQEAFQSAAVLNFGTNFIHCMCNSSDVAYNMKASLVWRNSVDYFPNRPMDIQQRHVYINIMNNLWTSTFAIPDWDMFQSHNPESAFHAAARAISGGPVYVCDSPYKQNFELLKKLCLSDGTILRCDAPALPSRDRIFINCSKEKVLAKVTNHCGAIGVLGIFNCTENAATITDTFSPSDVEDLKGDSFAAYFNTTGELKVVSKYEKILVKLAPMEYELVTIAPIDQYVAPLGLLNKLNTSAAIINWEILQDGSYLAKLKEGGERVGFYCKTKPSKVYLNNNLAPVVYDNKSGLLIVDSPDGKPIEVIIYL